MDDPISPMNSNVGLINARATWGALSIAQRLAMIALSEETSGGRLTQLQGKSIFSGPFGNPIRQRTIEHLVRRKLADWSESKRVAVLNDRGRFVLAHGIYRARNLKGRRK